MWWSRWATRRYRYPQAVAVVVTKKQTIIPPAVLAEPKEAPKASVSLLPSLFGKKPTIEYYERLWESMVIRQEYKAEIDRVVDKILANKERYQAVEKVVGVPWALIAAIHDQESSLNFAKYIGNGQSLKMRTTIVPTGRGPFETWEDGCVDAFGLKKSRFPEKWTICECLKFAEAYNGLGYFMYKNVNSPYLWARSAAYSGGHYISDGKFSYTAVRQKPGVAVILKTLLDRGEAL